MQMHMETMTSRQRIIRTLRREPVDRMPIDLGGHYSTGISAFAYWHLREYLGLDTANIWLPDMVQVLAFVDEDIRRRFHCDCVLLHPGWPRLQVWTPRAPYIFGIPSSAVPQLTVNGEWIISRRNGEQVRQMCMPEGGYFFDGDWINNWHECDDDTLLRCMAHQAKLIYNESDYATMYIGGFDAFFGNIDFLCQMYTDPQGVHDINRKKLESALKKASMVIEAMGEYIQLIEINSDMGMQTGPMCSPSMFEKFVVPYLSKLCKFIHTHSDYKVFLHSCGSIKPLIPMLIECGIDVLNPVQVSAADMDPFELKAKFGDKLIFWGGGCNTQHVLGRGTTDEVAKDVRRLISAFKPGGGFVFSQVHNIMGDVPPENIVTMLDTAYVESWYTSQKNLPEPSEKL